MNKEIINYEGLTLERVQKTTAKRLFDKGECIFIVGDNANINSPWVELSKIYSIPCDNTSTFNNYVNSYYFYNSHFIRNGLKYYKDISKYYVSYWRSDDTQDAFYGTYSECLDFIIKSEDEEKLYKSAISLIDCRPQLLGNLNRPLTI